MNKPMKGMWYKASASGPNDNCVEIFHGDSTIGVRDSKNPEGPALSFLPDEWDAFVAGAKAGEFDRP